MGRSGSGSYRYPFPSAHHCENTRTIILTLSLFYARVTESIGWNFLPTCH
jgi:hypothetical protein